MERDQNRKKQNPSRPNTLDRKQHQTRQNDQNKQNDQNNYYNNR